MDAYKSYIGDHLISCANYPGYQKQVSDYSGTDLIALIKRPMQGSAIAQDAMAQTKTVVVNDDPPLIFTRQGLEYYSGKLSLTTHLLSIRKISELKGANKTVIKIS